LVCRIDRDVRGKVCFGVAFGYAVGSAGIGNPGGVFDPDGADLDGLRGGVGVGYPQGFAVTDGGAGGGFI